MKKGRKRPADAELLISQVRDRFGKKKDELGAKKAAKQIGVCLASFYKYVKGETLPDFEVLRRAHHEWGIRWKYIDTAEILPIKKVKSPRQAVFAFLKALDDDDVKIHVDAAGETTLKIELTVRFPA